MQHCKLCTIVPSQTHSPTKSDQWRFAPQMQPTKSRSTFNGHNSFCQKIVYNSNRIHSHCYLPSIKTNSNAKILSIYLVHNHQNVQFLLHFYDFQNLDSPDLLLGCEAFPHKESNNPICFPTAIYEVKKKVRWRTVDSGEI